MNWSGRRELTGRSFGVSVCRLWRRHNQYMNPGLLILPLLVTACSGAVNTFEVNVPEPASAELQLCGQRTSLERSGENLVATRRISCEGHGAIVVRIPKKPTIKCTVGYVTPGVEQNFRYEVHNGRCI